MLEKLKKNKLPGEVIAALIIVVLMSGFLFVIFGFGFNWPLYFLLALAVVFLVFAYPASAIYSGIFLTLIFAQHFTLQSVYLNNTEYKFYLLDLLLVPFLAAVFLKVINGRIKAKIRLPDVLLILFIGMVAVYLALSLAVWHGSFDTAFSSFKNYAFYPLVFFGVFFIINSRRRFKRLFGFWLAGSMGIIFFVAYGLITGRGIWTEITPLTTAGNRLLAFDHAFYLSLSLIIGLNYIVFKRDKLTKLWYVLLPVFALGIVGSLMRHLWLALLAALIMLIVMAPGLTRKTYKKLLSKYAAAAVMIISINLLVAILLPGTKLAESYNQANTWVWDRASSITNTEDSSFAWREEVWRGGWEKLSSTPLLGIGFGQKIFIDMGDFIDYVNVKNIHNSWLAILVQMGALGLFIILAFCAIVFKNVVRLKTASPNWLTAKYALGGIMIFMFVAFLFQPYLEANFFNFIFWGALGASRRLYEGFVS